MFLLVVVLSTTMCVSSHSPSKPQGNVFHDGKARSNLRQKENRLLDTTTDEYLICQLKEIHIMLKKDNKVQGEVMHSCLTSPTQEADAAAGMIYALPEAFVQTLDVESIKTGGKAIEIQGAQALDNVIVIPDDANVVVSQIPSNRQLVTTTFGVKTVLTLRVSSLDATNSLDAATISSRLYTGNGATISSIYHDCSWNSLNLIPATGYGITNGVAEIFINQNTVGETSLLSIENAVTAVAQKQVPNFDSIDHVMYCMPAGTAGDWIAYGYSGWSRTVFNNEWCGYVSSAVHEIGHNLGLSHSAKGNVEYGDKQGMMGFSYRRINAPAMCFNAHKHWFLGWYQSRSISVNLSSGSWLGRVVAFTDYDQAGTGDYVVVKVGNLYIQYNKAEKFNYQTVDKKNQLTIVTADNDSAISHVLGGIDLTNSTYRQSDFIGNTAINIKICSASEENEKSVFLVSIFLDFQSSSCDGPVSVPPDDFAPPFSMCFSGSTTVVVKDKGIVQMNDLQIGDQVLDDAGNFETVYSFGHRHETLDASFLQFLPSGIEISKDHMVKIDGRYIPASAVKVGNALETGNGDFITISEIRTVVRKGVYAPFTASGTIVVSNVKVSSYIAFQDSDRLKIGGWTTPFSYQWLAHASQAPHRVCIRIYGACDETYSETGMSTWIDGPYQLGLHFLELNAVAKALLLAPSLVCLSVVLAIESILNYSGLQELW